MAAASLQRAPQTQLTGQLYPLSPGPRWVKLKEDGSSSFPQAPSPPEPFSPLFGNSAQALHLVIQPSPSGWVPRASSTFRKCHPMSCGHLAGGSALPRGQAVCLLSGAGATIWVLGGDRMAEKPSGRGYGSTWLRSRPSRTVGTESKATLPTVAFV